MAAPMTVQELSDYLRLDRMTIYKMVKERSIPASRIGHQWRFFREDIDEWIRSQRLDRRVRVLVVDADPGVRDLLAEALPPRSYELVMAESAQEPASQRQFHLAFVRLSREAAETFRRLRTVDSGIHVVVAAGTPDKKLLAQMAEIGAFTLVKWPLSGREVKDAFASILGSMSIAAIAL